MPLSVDLPERCGHLLLPGGQLLSLSLVFPLNPTLWLGDPFVVSKQTLLSFCLQNLAYDFFPLE